MKVRVSHLPPEGLPIQTTLPLEALNARMNEGRAIDIVFTEAPAVEVLVTPTPHGAQISGKIRTLYTQGCGRCAESVARELMVPADWMLHRKPEHALAGGAGVRGSARKGEKRDSSRGAATSKKSLRQELSEAAEQTAEDLDYEDDIGISFFEGDQVDLEPLFQELLILPLKLFWSPPCSPDGTCTHCNKVVGILKEAEEATAPKAATFSLAELLKKAGVSNN
jgi:hypothetical protein